MLWQHICPVNAGKILHAIHHLEDKPLKKVSKVLIGYIHHQQCRYLSGLTDPLQIHEFLAIRILDYETPSISVLPDQAQLTAKSKAALTSILVALQMSWQMYFVDFPPKYPSCISILQFDELYKFKLLLYKG